MPRLNMWQRLGVVASILWMLGAAYHRLDHDGKQAVAFANGVVSLCREGHALENPTAADGYDCQAQWAPSYATIDDGVWVRAAFDAIVPVALGWVLAGIGVVTARWVLAGRKPPSR